MQGSGRARREASGRGWFFDLSLLGLPVTQGFGVSAAGCVNSANVFAGRPLAGVYLVVMFSGIYRRISSGGRPWKLVEQGSFRGRSERSHFLVRIHDHLRFYLVLRGPDLGVASRRDLRRAQDEIENSLGCIPLPPEGFGPSDRAPGHLTSAKALCDEYLSPHFPRREATVRRLVRRVHLRETESDGARGSAHREHI